MYLILPTPHEGKQKDEDSLADLGNQMNANLGDQMKTSRVLMIPFGCLLSGGRYPAARSDLGA